MESHPSRTDHIVPHGTALVAVADVIIPSRYEFIGKSTARESTYATRCIYYLRVETNSEVEHGLLANICITGSMYPFDQTHPTDRPQGIVPKGKAPATLFNFAMVYCHFRN